MNNCPTTKDIEFIGISDVASITGINVYDVCRMVIEREIPHYNPCDKMLVFERNEIINWNDNRCAKNN